MIERWHPLSAVTQVTNQETNNQCWTRWTLTSEDSHILLWNKTKILVVVSRRSRTTLTDVLFDEIYNKTKPTTRSIRRQSKWFKTWSNVDLFELFETDFETQCKECLSYWSEGIVHCTCGKIWPIEVSLNIRPSLTSKIRDKEGKTSWPQIRANYGKERISSSP